MSLRDKIEKFAQERGLIWGIGSAEPFWEYSEGLSRPVPFVSYSGRERIDPSLTLPGARSLIALGLSYNHTYVKATEGLRGTLSAGAVGRDYHLILGEYLRELGELLFKPEEYLAFCDIGPLSDALVAIRCGIGCSGLNHSVINRDMGCMFFIGYIITTLSLMPTPLKGAECTGCNACVRACPAHALREDGTLIGERCVAYLTQVKGIIPDELKTAMGTYIYGCDMCRRACPLNPPGKMAEGLAYPLIEEILHMSNREFREKYGDTAIGWRGRRTIARNCLIALGNLGDRAGIALAREFVNDPAEEIRDAARWAVNKLSKKEE